MKKFKPRRPKGYYKVRRMARQIPDVATLDLLLEGATGEMRNGMLEQLRPHLRFDLPEDYLGTDR